MTTHHQDVDRREKSFTTILVIYLVVNAGLCALDVLTGTDKQKLNVATAGELTHQAVRWALKDR